MMVRSLLTVLGAGALVAVGLLGPVAGAQDVAVQPASVHESLEGLPVAEDPPPDDAAMPPLGAASAADAADDAADDAAEHDSVEVSEPVAPPIAFSMVGFAVPEGAAVAFRHRSADGAWSPWEGVHLHPDEGPDPDSDEAGAGGPVVDDQGRVHSLPAWTGAADELQVRVQGAALAEVGVDVVDGLGQNRDLGERLGDAVDALATAVRGGATPAAADLDRPDLVTRDDWGAAEAGDPVLAEGLEAVVLHHTVHANDYDRDEAAALVRSIQRYHMDGLGWRDLGYNFLIDRHGQVFEGRGGGIDEPVIGAHASGHNTGTAGVAFLGQHHDDLDEPAPSGLSAEAEDAAASLVTWLLDVHHLDAHEPAELPSGTTLPASSARLVGHSDVGATACPGSAVTERLDAIREAVAGEQPAMFADVDDAQARGVLDVEEGLELSATLTPPGSWSFTVTDEQGEVLHRDEGHGERAAVAWQPEDTTSEQLTWTLSGEGRRPVEGTVTVSRITVDRMPTDDPVTGSVALSRLAFPEEGSASHAVVARDDLFPDAMTGGPLAGADGPLLLTPSDELHAATAEELRRVLPEGATVHVLGGEAALSAEVEDALADRWHTRRLAGPDRHGTAAAVAEAVLDRSGADEVLLARSDGPRDPWADAIAGGVWGAAEGVPVVLTPTDALDPQARELVEDVERVTVLGGSAAIGEEVTAALPGAQRLAGDDRAATAVAVARERWGSRGEELLLAPGSGDDAWQLPLAASPLAARRDAPLLLLADEVPEPTAAHLSARSAGAPPAERVLLLGSWQRVPWVTAEEVRALLH